MKECNKCNTVKSLDEFHKWSRSSDGYKSTCKSCRKIEARKVADTKGVKARVDKSKDPEGFKTCTKCLSLIEKSKFSSGNSWCNSCRTKDNRERLGQSEKIKPIVNDDSKQCCHCMEVLPLDDFSPSERGRLGLAAYCKKCTTLKYKDKDKARVASKKYRETHRERYLAAHRIHQFNRKNLAKTTCDGTVTDEFLKELYGTENCYFCNKFTEVENRTLEHLQPLSKDGIHSKDNCTMACLSCNASKAAKTELEFKQYLYEYKNFS